MDALEVLYVNRVSGIALTDNEARISANFSASDLRVRECVYCFLYLANPLSYIGYEWSSIQMVQRIHFELLDQGHRCTQLPPHFGISNFLFLPIQAKLGPPVKRSHTTTFGAALATMYEERIHRFVLFLSRCALQLVLTLIYQTLHCNRSGRAHIRSCLYLWSCPSPFCVLMASTCKKESQGWCN